MAPLDDEAGDKEEDGEVHRIDVGTQYDLGEANVVLAGLSLDHNKENDPPGRKRP